MAFAKSVQVKNIAPLAEAIAGRDPYTSQFHSIKSSFRANANNRVSSVANTAVSLTYAAAGAGVSHVLTGLCVTAAGGTIGTLANAVGTLTSDNTNVSNGETVTIDTTVYTFKTALTPAEGEVLIGADADSSLLNLIRAINHTGTLGTDYQCAAAHPTVSAASSVTAHAFLVTARLPGPTPNAIATTETSAHLSWGGATLASGLGLVVTISDGSSVVFAMSIASSNQEKILFNPPLKGSGNTALTITATAGGAGVITCINALGHYTES